MALLLQSCMALQWAGLFDEVQFKAWGDLLHKKALTGNDKDVVSS